MSDLSRRGFLAGLGATGLSAAGLGAAGLGAARDQNVELLLPGRRG